MTPETAEKQEDTAQEAAVLFEIRGGAGIITLNRPRALNAINLEMIRAMTRQLKLWAKDDSVRCVIIEGAGDRAFCSGGDVKAVAVESLAVREGKSDGALCRDFFYEEYTLNHLIFTFPKPYISLINGIVMGGGKGISAHGSHRVVTENTLFAMPETSIGFFPDVGGGYFLPRCPGQTGTYLALTSSRITAVDTVYIGFATHHIAAERLDDLRAALCENGSSDKAEISTLIESFCTPTTRESEIAAYREKIDSYFGHDRVEDIFSDLEKDTDPWCAKTLTAMHEMSPTSLKIALKQIRLGAALDFAKVMTMEYRLSQACVRGHDFYEGIRAALIDKDRQPQWKPERVADVADEEIAAYFDTAAEKDLVL